MKTTDKKDTKETEKKATSATTKTASKTAEKSTAKSDSKSTSTAKSGGKEVKAKKSAAEDLREFFVDALKDIYWAEKALTKALPKMSKNATSKKLIEALNSHLTETEGQIERLQQVFEMIGEKAVAKKCEAMAGLIKEGEEILEETEPGAVRDAGIIAASQKIEHYEIATYGTLCAYAKTLGEIKAGKLLHESLEEEKAADKTLTEAAYNDINFDAAEA
ncbi:YciE/YciF ferroxidase family protein [Flavobacterium ardleyense]|uniref:YciE/YciF ferroxidase family protein n=1 Tax=Flavobacterium ardleyense TaxID=2038737 RepID=UPI00298BD2E2|nr:ferritin-like domain-containing protein [Flavobacterium ardleyense]